MLEKIKDIKSKKMIYGVVLIALGVILLPMINLIKNKEFEVPNIVILSSGAIVALTYMIVLGIMKRHSVRV